MSTKYSEHLDIHPKVQEALDNGKPIVALESTIISHGMSYPKNVETALAVEAAVWAEGAVPATIAVINGRMKAGLTGDEIELLGKTGHEITKTSRRDLPYIIANKQSGATTVAATMIIAQLAGIPIFATGGIGGVHRGAVKTMDISADLQELANTNVTVVSAGVKSILDIGMTLEYLETFGVPVIGYQTEEFPAFFTRQSGYSVDYRIDSAAEIASLIHVKRDLGLQGGVVVANPVPEEFQMDKEEIDDIIIQALEDATIEGVSGRKVTPYLLQRIEALTAGKSLFSNIQLVLNNARLGAQIAVALSQKS